MKIIGITGGIGTGKTKALNFFKSKNIPCYESDRRAEDLLNSEIELIKTIKEKFGNNPNFFLEEGVIPPEKFHKSVCLISDWSGISFEYAFTFKRPVIFIDVPKKILNPNFQSIHLEPIEISLRTKLGHVISPILVNTIPEIIENSVLNNSKTMEIKKISSQIVYNIGTSAKIGADAIEQISAELNK